MEADKTKDERRRDALCCAGERFFSHVHKGSFDLKRVYDLQDLFSMYEEAEAAGRGSVSSTIRAEIERRMPWAKEGHTS